MPWRPLQSALPPTQLTANTTRLGSTQLRQFLFCVTVINILIKSYLAVFVCSLMTSGGTAFAAGSGQVLAGSGILGSAPDGALAKTANLGGITTVLKDPKGGFYFTDSQAHTIRHVDASGVLKTVAGTGSPNWCGDNRPALQFCFATPHGITAEPDGRLIVADTFHNRIVRIEKNGIAHTVAGSGSDCRSGSAASGNAPSSGVGGCGEGGPAAKASLHWPTIARRINGDLYISDSSNRILKVSGLTNKITRFAGTGSWGYSGNGGPASEARLFAPADMIAYKTGIVISDGNNCRLRFVSDKDVITNFAGSGAIKPCWNSYGTIPFFSFLDWLSKWGGPLASVGDGGVAGQAQFRVTGFLATDGKTTLWVTDFLNNRVRQIKNNKVSTVLGTGEKPGMNGAGPMDANRMRIGWPSGIEYVNSKNLLMTDGYNNRVIALRLP